MLLDRPSTPTPAPATAPVSPGLHVDASGNGTFAVAAPRAEAVDLCIRTGDTEHRRRLRHVDGAVHWDTVRSLVPGTRYGLRAHGPWDPDAGYWFNPAKLLLDPYGRGISHASPLLSAMFPHDVDSLLDEVRTLDPDGTPVPTRSDVDSGDVAVWSVVTEDAFDWRADAPPATSWEDSVLYELHVKGYTATHPEVPTAHQGTYAGLAHPAVIDHLRSLGVTAVELLPIHATMDEHHLARLGLTNYWGYSTLSFFAPNPAYATAGSRRSGAQAVLDEVKEMVRSLHAAGIEVILDVVYNHTAEGGHGGPSLSFRGLDNTEYYWMNEGTFVDVTGTGSTLDPRDVHVVDLVLSSLRYWVQHVHVDGFRFDLAATLGRDDAGFRADHPLLRAIVTDPVLRGVKLIAEPWDIGGGGWQTGNFPVPFAEWNDAFRNDVRSFWLADPGARARTGDGGIGGVRDLATRLAGSQDLFARHDPGDLPPGRFLRTPSASINYVTAHDGFTLEDLLTFEHKHNEANRENNRDGSDDNRSWNHGHEGTPPADSPAAEQIRAARDRSARNLLATLLLASGTPMITAGDEFGRTQGGNNNAYCQDNETSWIDWDLSTAQAGRVDTVQRLTALRRRHPQLRAGTFLHPADPERPDLGQVAWFQADGGPMRHEDWLEGRHVLQMLLCGPRGEDHLLAVFSSSAHDVEVTLPGAPWPGEQPRVLFHSARNDSSTSGGIPRRTDGTHALVLPGPCVVLIAVRGTEDQPERLS